MEYKLEFLSYLIILKKKNERLTKFDEQIKTCINTFEKAIIDEKDLIYLFERNILDINPSIRSICWKLALKHLSLNTGKWNQEILEKRKLYEEYIKYFVLNPLMANNNIDKESTQIKKNRMKEEMNLKSQEEEKDISFNLNEESDTNWMNSELFSQINKDTFRTRPELSFFNLNPEYTINNNINILNSLINMEDFEEENEEIPFLVNINSDNNLNCNENVQNDNRYSIEKKKICKNNHIDNVEEHIKNVFTNNEKKSNKKNMKEENEVNIMKDTYSENNNVNSHNSYINNIVKDQNNLNLQEKFNSEDSREFSQNLSIEINESDNYNSFKNEKNRYDSIDVCDILKPRRHYDLLCRILFIYAQIHPYVKYVQGMNEILAPLYFIIFNDPLCNCPLQGEADTFFCFIELMQKQKDVFCEGLDNTDDGINGKLKKFSLLLKIKEYKIWKRLNILKIETQYYALKWILLLLTQEFDMPDTIILYDHFIINTNENFILYICLVICMKLKNSLLCGNFSVNLKLLQNIPPFDPYDIICHAKDLMKKDLEKNFNITDVYNQYVSEKRRKCSSENFKNDNKEDICEYSSNVDESDESRKSSIFNNLKNKPFVQNIKNYISNKIDIKKRSEEINDFN
ncbi:TBC domain protein, putative [Plasmodium gallinaceum]|uniref:TBC domain protein, putative n=1 Tax=Plasmodium gallinaceum TaxID=5849 RepID=A0A1J1GYR0_PLAGA|nr:TBC domain protein, putative [Plasmodium gallinaceum]CRG97592.1 TBC domain protein, putative [Plasmodium gallinaceum]